MLLVQGIFYQKQTEQTLLCLLSLNVVTFGTAKFQMAIKEEGGGGGGEGVLRPKHPVDVK